MPARDSGTWMWAEACELLDRADRLHRQFFQLGRSYAGRPSWEPPLDVFESDGELWILAALPGVAVDQLQVVVDGRTLIITGERPLPAELRDAYIHRLEIPHGRFERRVELPVGRFELGQRELVNGCLALSLRKSR